METPSDCWQEVAPQRVDASLGAASTRYCKGRRTEERVTTWECLRDGVPSTDAVRDGKVWGRALAHWPRACNAHTYWVPFHSEGHPSPMLRINGVRPPETVWIKPGRGNTESEQTTPPPLLRGEACPVLAFGRPSSSTASPVPKRPTNKPHRILAYHPHKRARVPMVSVVCLIGG